LRIFLGPQNRTHPLADPQLEDTSLACPDRTGRPPLPALPSSQMAGILVHPHPLHGPPLQTQALPSPSYLFFRQASLLPWGRPQTFPLPSYCRWPPPPHTHLRSRPPHSKLRCAQRHERLLAQGPEIDHEQLLLHPNLHPVPRGLPPPHSLLLQIPEAPCRPQSCLRPPECQSGLGQTPTILPLPLLL